MKLGFDTSFLVVAEVTGHPEHEATRVRLTELSDTGSRFAMAPQVLAEFLHIVTDTRSHSPALQRGKYSVRAHGGRIA